MRKIISLTALLLVAGCATAEPRVVTHDVLVPVKEKCVPVQLAAAPTYPDTDDALKGAPDAAERYKLIAAGRKLRIGRLSEVEPVIEGCR